MREPFPLDFVDFIWNIFVKQVQIFILFVRPKLIEVEHTIYNCGHNCDQSEKEFPRFNQHLLIQGFSEWISKIIYLWQRQN